MSRGYPPYHPLPGGKVIRLTETGVPYGKAISLPECPTHGKGCGCEPGCPCRAGVGGRSQHPEDPCEFQREQV